MKAIINGRFILPDSHDEFWLRDKKALLFDDRIRLIRDMPADGELPGVDEVIDAGGAYVAPGFINVHIHGCVGADTMDAKRQALDAICLFQASTGVTAVYPTTMTQSMEDIYLALDTVRQAMAEPMADGARILGVHLEGPFVNRERRGAQPLEFIRKPDFSLIKDYTDVIKLITIAPEELDGDYSFLEECRENGIVVSFGHSKAGYDLVKMLIEKYGVNHITHLGNGMNPIMQRTPGLAGAALDTDADCEIIADNVHLHITVQRMIMRMKQGRHIMLITDSFRGAGLGDGYSEIGGQLVDVHGPLALLRDGTIAGSVITMNRAVANFAINTAAPMAQIVSYATQVPAKNMGIYDERGSLAVGKRADIVIFDDNVNIKRTIIGGESVYWD